MDNECQKFEAFSWFSKNRVTGGFSYFQRPKSGSATKILLGWQPKWKHNTKAKVRTSRQGDFYVNILYIVDNFNPNLVPARRIPQINIYFPFGFPSKQPESLFYDTCKSFGKRHNRHLHQFKQTDGIKV